MSYNYRSYNLGWGGGLTRGVKSLLLVNGIVYLAQLFLRGKLLYIFGLTPILVKEGYVWQLFTYMFLHGGLFHILFNMFALYIFGGDIERAWGTKEFIKYYFIAGVGAGIASFLLSFNSSVVTIGASGAIFGLLVAFALMFPERIIYLYFLFPIKAKYLALLLGGMVVGYLYLKADWRIKSFFRYLGDIGHNFKVKASEKKRKKTERLMSKVDQILDKINQVGYQNLTKEEKKLLEEASHRLSDEKK